MAHSGIYEIVNTVNGKRYVGSAVDIEQRWREHRWGLTGGRHGNRHLQSSWNKHGEASFSFMVLEVCRPMELIAREQAAIDALHPEYNICPVAGSTLGRPHTEEAKAKIGARLRGKPRDPDVVASIAEKLRGRTRPPEDSAHLAGNKHAEGHRHTDEWKAANSALHTGRKRPKSPEYRAKISATLRERAKDPAVRERMRRQAADAWASKPQADRDLHMEKVRAARGEITEDQRAAISARQIGRPMHPNAAAALHAANKGRKLSPEHRQTLSDIGRGSWTPERKAKQSEALRAYHQRGRLASSE